MSRARRLRPAAAALALAALAAGCSGYEDLPVPVREEAELVVEAAQRFPDAAGLVQVAVVRPDGVAGPLFVVTPPVTGLGGRVANWAVGPCPGAAPTVADPALRLCVALVSDGGAAAGPVALGLVLEARESGRRFTAIGEVPAP